MARDLASLYVAPRRCSRCDLRISAALPPVALLASLVPGAGLGLYRCECGQRVSLVLTRRPVVLRRTPAPVVVRAAPEQPSPPPDEAPAASSIDVLPTTAPAVAPRPWTRFQPPAPPSAMRPAEAAYLRQFLPERRRAG